MNSEELELSLRTEFESYLKGLTADTRREVADFQAKIESEFEKHKNQLDTAFREFSDRLGSEKEFDGAFSEAVVEHLRLARDEGAQIAANAFSDAEELRQNSESAARSADSGYGSLRNAVAEISTKTSQATILRSLVEHAAQFTSRGAFFIVKNEMFVGWKVFGESAFAGDETVRSIEFPTTSDTILADSINSLTLRFGSFRASSDDVKFLEPLGFGEPGSMAAIPLIARGRGVAVLYADSDSHGSPVNIEALETLVRVAGLTVELLASAQGATTPAAAQGSADQHVQEDAVNHHHEPQVSEHVEAENGQESFDREYVDAGAESIEPTTDVYEVEAENAYAESPVAHEPVSESNYGEIVYEEAAVYEESAVEEEHHETYPETIEVERQEVYQEVAEEPAAAESGFEFASDAVIVEEAPFEEPAVQEMEVSQREVSNDLPYVGETTSDHSFTTTESFGTISFDQPQVESIDLPSVEPVEEKPEPEVVTATVAEPVVETVSAGQARSRFSSRNVDLPIEVAEDERRLHNDARRFARLLVSEIKLYNEQKVSEGREAGDLYDRLREAIDRSREMYSKRVHAPVAAKFDYFHYELVNSLGEGDADRLGSNYPGATV